MPTLDEIRRHIPEFLRRLGQVERALEDGPPSAPVRDELVELGSAELGATLTSALLGRRQPGKKYARKLVRQEAAKRKKAWEGARRQEVQKVAAEVEALVGHEVPGVEKRTVRKWRGKLVKIRTAGNSSRTLTMLNMAAQTIRDIQEYKPRPPSRRGKRDDFPPKVRQLLAESVGQVCSKPDCRAATSGPSTKPDGAVRVGVASHITAASPGGPRYDDSLTQKQRQSKENGIWLCQIHGKMIDDDPDRYGVDLLKRWKAEAESEQDARIGRTAAAPQTTAPCLRWLVDGRPTVALHWAVGGEHPVAVAIQPGRGPRLSDVRWSLRLHAAVHARGLARAGEDIGVHVSDSEVVGYAKVVQAPYLRIDQAFGLRVHAAGVFDLPYAIQANGLDAPVSGVLQIVAERRTR